MFLTFVAALLGVNARAASAVDNAESNTVFILVDGFVYGELGCHGQEKIRTPVVSASVRISGRSTGEPSWLVRKLGATRCDCKQLA